jgi:predicted house-cleaning noncanonical NTP pyrophosphatase (MazG superfamily)
MSEEITEEQAKEMLRDINSGNQNLHSFFSKIITANRTLKTGNLSETELGMSKLPVRTYEELALFSRDVADENEWADYFEKMSEIQTASSLSKDATLLKLAVTIKKELADMTPGKKSNKGWFKKKDSGNSGESSE